MKNDGWMDGWGVTNTNICIKVQVGAQKEKEECTSVMRKERCRPKKENQKDESTDRIEANEHQGISINHNHNFFSASQEHHIATLGLFIHKSCWW